MTTIRDLISDGSCTAACVTAQTTARSCRCPCAGRHHGLIATAAIEALLEARAAGLHRLNDLEVVAQ